MAVYIRADGCSCGCDFSLYLEGGDAGWDTTYDLITGGGSILGAGSLEIDWVFNTKADRLQVYLDGSGTAAYDTGCTTGAGGTMLALPACSSTVRLVVTPNCLGDTGTFWSFNVVCSVP